MRLSPWQRFLVKLRLKYKIKREIFTLLIPSLVSLFILIVAYDAGYFTPAAVGTGIFPPTPVSNNALAQREAEIAILNNQSLPASNLTRTISNPIVQKQRFDFLVVATIWVAFGPYAVDTTLRERKARRYKKDFVAFLFELSELVQGGIDPVKGFLKLSESNVGSVTKFVHIAAKQMQIGYSFEQAMRNLGENIGNDLVKNYIDLVIQASYSGGSVGGLIQRASNDMSTFITIDEEKRAGLSQYTAILYVGQVLLIALAAIIVVQFLPNLNAINSIAGAGISGLFQGSNISAVTTERDLFYLVLINGFFGGLVIGKISEGRIKYGLKHSLALVLIALIAWSAFVTPFSTTVNQSYTITPITYDRSGVQGIPLKDPLVVRITDSRGHPVKNVAVSFSISGDGRVNPASALTDDNGTVSTQVTLGTQASIYTVTVTAGESSIVLPILTAAQSGG